MLEFWRFNTTSLENLQVIEGEYNFFVIILSFLISNFAAFALLVVLERAWQSQTSKTRLLWKIFGSIVFGLGVWAMHFTGMMAFILPIHMSYDIGLTILSVITPMVGTFLALGRLSEEKFSFVSILLCSTYLALAIGSMHYTGMEAMKMNAIMSYNLSLFITSIATAFILAMIAIYSIKAFNSNVKHTLIAKIPSSIAMGAAVAGMHYIAMSAANYHIDAHTVLKHQSMSDSAIAFSLAIAGIVFVIVATTILCALIEDKLQQAEQKIEENAIREKDILEHMADGLLTMRSSGIVESINSAGALMFGYPKESIIGNNIETLIDTDKVKDLKAASLHEKLKEQLGKTLVTHGIKLDGSYFPVEIHFSKILLTTKNHTIFNCVVRDITERVQLEQQLRQSQKLESIGQLSAGIAHEINTPAQYVSDNTMFLNTAFESCLKILRKTQALVDKEPSEISSSELTEIITLFKENDMEFVIEEIPLAITQSIDGLERVKKIVGAMKSFSHSSPGEMSLVDIAEAINSTITVSRSEWRYIAELTTSYTENLPKIKCLRDEFNQVILNCIVNAAHAIEAKNGQKSAELGTIEINVTQAGQYMEILICDNGIGMTSKVKSRIFDPFFTTKDVGKGTGQGLSMAYSVIVEKHSGKIEVESEVNVGTQFKISLPIS
ncbi:MAG: MHYT domain-containing protein [Paraglaciecola sp.]|uniref:MHYT domain-containing protein n=2 Tax=Paraglaciecola sp. TaxID=1920173 RepID=UPI0032998825